MSASTEPYGSSQAAFLKLAGVCARNASLEKVTKVALALTQSVTKTNKRTTLVRRMLSSFKTSGLEEDKILCSAQRREYKYVKKNKKNDNRKS